MLPDPAPLARPAAALEVYALCAQWCGVCRSFRTLFDSLPRQMPQTRFHWLDVEDEAQWCDALDIEDFPTLLVLKAGQPCFFGPILPTRQALHNTLRAVQSGACTTIPAEIHHWLGTHRATH